MVDNVEQIQRQMYEDVRWARGNAEFQKLYPGQLVVVHRKQFLLAGHGRRELLERAAREGHPLEELIVIAIPTDDFAVPSDAVQ